VSSTAGASDLLGRGRRRRDGEDVLDQIGPNDAFAHRLEFVEAQSGEPLLDVGRDGTGEFLPKLFRDHVADHLGAGTVDAFFQERAIVQIIHSSAAGSFQT
jgi:hypothetical protein